MVADLSDAPLSRLSDCSPALLFPPRVQRTNQYDSSELVTLEEGKVSGRMLRWGRRGLCTLKARWS